MQEAQGRFLAHVQAQFLQIGDDLKVAARFGIQNQVRERRVEQFPLLAALHRLEARHEASLFRKAAEKRLAEAMDGQYLQSATGCIQHFCEQLPCLLPRLWACIGINRLKVMEQ